LAPVRIAEIAPKKGNWIKTPIPGTLRATASTKRRGRQNRECERIGKPAFAPGAGASRDCRQQQIVAHLNVHRLPFLARCPA
jgi:hypothetical protein